MMTLLMTLTTELVPLLLAVTFAGSLAVLVTIQIMTAMSLVNLVSRKDEPPNYLIAPLEGILGRVLCLSDVPLFGQVRRNAKDLDNF